MDTVHMNNILTTILIKPNQAIHIYIFQYVLSIDPKNGTVSVKNTLGEEESNRDCTIYATDSGNPPKRSNASLIIKDPDEPPTTPPSECVVVFPDNGAVVLTLQIITGVLSCLVVVLSAFLLRNRLRCLKTIQTKRARSTASIHPEVPVDPKPKKNEDTGVLIPAQLPVRLHQVLDRNEPPMPPNNTEPVYHYINEQPTHTPPASSGPIRKPLPAPNIGLNGPLKHPVDQLTSAQRDHHMTRPSGPRRGTLPPLQTSQNIPQHGKEKRKKRKRSQVHPKHSECRSDRDSGLGHDDSRGSFTDTPGPDSPKSCPDSPKTSPDSPKAWSDSPKAWPDSPKAWSDSPKAWPDSAKARPYSPKVWPDSPKLWSNSPKVLPNDHQTLPDEDSEVSDTEQVDNHEDIDSDARPVYEYDTEATTEYGSMLSL
ncbi:protein FAM193B-like [Branchiostoma floridae]|uniref:Protein FAM193B-like n=1 Tax=Branchiostoma floridae TaxID=7739 RepID=A0A9J7KAN6_BRAFL|nr:protein FAM193B-like [Branchiostoma floridae]